MRRTPSAEELLDALTVFLQDEVVSALEGRARFHALVAANVAGIVARELRLGPEAVRAQCERLAELLDIEETAGSDSGSSRGGGADLSVGGNAALATRGGSNQAGAENLAQRADAMERELTDRIDAGLADSGPWRTQVMTYLRSTLRDQLEIDNPRFDQTRPGDQDPSE